MMIETIFTLFANYTPVVAPFFHGFLIKNVKMQIFFMSITCSASLTLLKMFVVTLFFLIYQFSITAEIQLECY